jgi:hypothetical protein
VTLIKGGNEKMKVMNITDINGLFKVIDSCTGKVELVSNEGDRLNLKSKLSQYVSLANLFSDGKIDELELVAYEPEDIERLVKFMYNGE